ncbi:hypothetical protein J1N35_004079 [Gossypium stocksii]|uniref:C-JID domain-containing protein n=1 Tax=Gossypium stocksii TaxID=47602 RepID=A0A9D4AHB7_9ROSI|nr:hypothetical protein J1N35_004079 [Gossypium stocksii]
MECLKELCLDGTGIKELLSSIGHLRRLMLLNLKDYSKLESLPSSIGGCEFLKSLILSGYSKLKNFPESLQQLESLEELNLSETAITTPPSFIFHMKNLKFLSLQGCKRPPYRVRSHWRFISRPTQRLILNSMTLKLSAILSGLSSLKELNLDDCNLYDGAILDDIIRLSSLEKLRLSDNNFRTLPTTLGGLSKLTNLVLIDCKRLKSLPELLASIKLWLDGCGSLEAVSNSTTIFNSRVDGYICALNCFKLAEGNDAVTMLKRCIQEGAKVRTTNYHIIIPRSEIPKWFTNQTDDPSDSIIKIQLPPGFLIGRQLVGFAFCCVFFSNFDNKPRRGEHLSHASVIHGRNFYREFRRYDFHLEGKSTRGIHSKLKKCGAQMVYKQDLEEMDQTGDEQ